jgi:mannose-6-phosphate isomerase-like protein (cupin superfamily)
MDVAQQNASGVASIDSWMLSTIWKDVPMRSLIACVLAVLGTATLSADDSLAQRIQHTDATKYRPLTAVHGGAGNMAFTGLLPRGAVTPHFNFLHRGEIPAGSGIGHHFHNTAEEMFVILGGEAQFTVDGRTSIVKGPAAVVCKLGHSHAIHNHSTQPLQWMNWQVAATPNVTDAFDLGDTRVGVPIDPVPVFMTARLDRALARPAADAPGVTTRRLYQPQVFTTPWTYVDHVVIAPGAAMPAKAHETVGEAYYVIAGSGKLTVGAEAAPIAVGDAIPVRLGETSTLANVGSEPLELLVIGVAKDLDAKTAFILASAPRRP